MQIVRPEREAHISLRFDVVPAYEVLLGLAAAAQPERHELPASWGRQVRQSLPHEVRRDLRFFFGDPMALGVGAVRLVPDLTNGEPETFVGALEAHDTADLLALLLSRGMASRQLLGAFRRSVRSRATPDDERLVEQHLRSLRAETRRRITAILDEPDSMRARYIGLVRAFHENWLATQLPEVLPVVSQRAKQGRRSIGKLPAVEVVARATGGFTLRSRGVRSVALIPSYYATPFVYVVREGRDAILVYGARSGQIESDRSSIDSQSVKILKALADETRLRILQLLARRPMYGQQLAEALGVSHPTISHHMAQLRVAGLTRTELDEEGNKTYFVRPEVLEALFADLREAFVEPAEPSVVTGNG